LAAIPPHVPASLVRLNGHDLPFNSAKGQSEDQASEKHSLNEKTKILMPNWPMVVWGRGTFFLTGLPVSGTICIVRLGIKVDT
jgi:hypothetical protein